MRISTMLSGAFALAFGFAAQLQAADPVQTSDGTQKPAAQTESKPASKDTANKAATTGTPAAAPAAAGTQQKASQGTVVEMNTSEGMITIELADKDAPVTVKNFVKYVNDKFYDGTIFHRVIKGFMIQGGGFVLEGNKLSEKSTGAPITNEAKNGLKNDMGTIAMARTSDPNSATAQFFINHVSNDGLNYPKPDGHGYAVFGKVTAGMDIVEKIAGTPTTMKGGMSDVPVKEVKILTMIVKKPGIN